MSHKTSILSSILRPGALSTKYLNVVIMRSASSSFFSAVNYFNFYKIDLSSTGSTNDFSD